MRILSCHIENFGKIHDLSMDFCHGANIICEENGWGKSTFAAFVRAMFYGLEGDRKRSLEENERKRYKPWQGGVFGGQLVFEIQGKRYLISRIFKDKEANDEFELRDAGTNLPSADYTNKIGEEIFRINRESFLRTIFIGQNQCETSSSDDINARIGKLADNTNDLNNYEAANGKLTEILNKLNPNRVSGSISKRSEEIAKYDRIVKGGEGISGSIEEYQKYLQREEDLHELLRERMKEAGEKQKAVSRQQSAAAGKSEWDRLRQSAAKKAEEKETVRQKFPGEVPDPEDVKEKIAECGAMERIQERVSMYRMSREERDELDSLSEVFAGGVPSDAEIEDKINETMEFRKLGEEYRSEQISAAERERLDELEPFFADDLESVTSMVGKWNNRNARKAALPSKQAALTALRASMESRRSRSSGRRSALLILGIVLVVMGAVLAAVLVLADAQTPAGGIGIIAAGVGILLKAMLTDRKGAGSAKTQPEFSPEYVSLSQAIEEDENYIAGTDEMTADYITAHGKEFDEDTVSAVLQEITTESIEYTSLKKKYQKACNSTKAKELERMRYSIRTFLGRYGVAAADSKLADNLYILKSRAEKYRALLDRQDRFEKAGKDYETLKRLIAAFLEEYGFQPSDTLSLQLGDIRDWVNDYRDAVKALADAEKELKQFEAENDISALEEMRIDESLPTLEELNQTIQELAERREEVHNKIGGYNSTLENLQEEYDEWEETCEKLTELRELQALEQKKYRQIFLARKKLEQAREAMTARYADPILQGFGKYYEMISGTDAGRFHIDANTAVTVDELGKQRDINALSSGCRDLIGICLRIALVDAMYQEEAPILIMDDPFTNLDDRKVSAGRDFVEKLGEKYQIIYFTCSAARG